MHKLSIRFLPGEPANRDRAFQAPLACILAILVDPTARLLKHLVHRDGTLKRLFEFHWIDGAIASCLRNIAKRTMNSASRVVRLHNAEIRVLAAIAHAQSSEQKAGCHEIYADIFEIKGDVKQAKAMYRSALAS